MTRGIFFSLDGIDGAGKSTQLQRFIQWLADNNHDVVECRDPGSTALGEAIRNLLLDRHDLAIDRRSEMLLYMAARAQLVEEVIRPALEQGKTVVSDRFLLANVAYQAYAGGLDVQTTWDVGEVATSGLSPDLTFVLDVSVEVAYGRMDREHDRMEQQGQTFLHRVRMGFLTEAARKPDRIVVINAERSPDTVQAEIRDQADRVLSIRKQTGKPGASAPLDK